ncbi:MAG TPA: inositol oxygenase family protein [Terriglobia bacterium]|nr:inositol oxygenase family protein [Terriglobia bacterium]
MDQPKTPAQAGPLKGLEEWDDFVKSRYAQGAPASPDKDPEEFRDYTDSTPERVKEFYRLNHAHQTRDFVREKKREFLPGNRAQMSLWEAMEFLNTLVDESDPDTELSQIEHLLQTAEAIRKDGKPDWFILTGLIHDLGKVLCLWGEPQWAVVGDTFPVGCAFSPAIVLHQYFALNPDSKVPAYQARLGVYSEHCGLDQVEMSWGHDEYMYHVAKDYLPEEALYMIRYHSFYPAHHEGDYEYLMNDHDQEMFRWVREFNPYDLYSKSDEPPKVDALRPYYEDLIAQYFPAQLRW